MDPAAAAAAIAANAGPDDARFDMEETGGSEFIFGQLRYSVRPVHLTASLLPLSMLTAVTKFSDFNYMAVFQ